VTEVLFYHLSAQPLERASPEILEKCVARGLRVTLRAGSRERVEALNAHYWTYRDEGFLPHGVAGDGPAERQPIYLTDGEETPNDPQVLMLVDGAEAKPEDMGRFERVVLMFDGNDAEAVDRARGQWRAVSEAGLKAIYWAQDDGRWVKKAENAG
jgi:DNA polymerase-3 subunit chi